MQNFLFFIFILLPSSLLADSFSCQTIFRDEYSVFMTYFLLPKNFKYISLKYQNRQMSGYLHFNYCGDTYLNDICGTGITVKGKVIFQNTTSKPGYPKCLVFNAKDSNAWKYFLENNNDDVNDFNGVRRVNEEMEVEVIGGSPGFMSTVANIIKDEIKKKVPELNNYFDLLKENQNNEKEKKIEMPMVPPEKFSIDNRLKNRLLSSKHKGRILTGSELKEKKPEVVRYMAQPVKLVNNFHCEKENIHSDFSFDSKQNILILNDYSSSGCVVEFKFLRFLVQE